MMIRLRGSVQDCIGRREAKVGVDAVRYVPPSVLSDAVEFAIIR